MVCLLREDLPLGDIEILKAGGNCHNLGIWASKKWRYIKDSHYFWGRCTPDRKIPVFVHGHVLHFLETCPRAVRNSCGRVPANPNLHLEAGNFPTHPAQGGVAQGSENRENSPAPSVPGGYHQRMHLQPSCCANTATCPIVYLPQGLNSFLFAHSAKHCVLCGCFIPCSYWHEGPRTACSYWGRGTVLGCWVLLLGKQQTWWSADRGVIKEQFSSQSSGTVTLIPGDMFKMGILVNLTKTRGMCVSSRAAFMGMFCCFKT